MMQAHRRQTSCLQLHDAQNESMKMNKSEINFLEQSFVDFVFFLQ